MDKDQAEILRIMEDNDKYIDAIYEAAEWCYRSGKNTAEGEAFIAAVKKEWEGIHDGN